MEADQRISSHKAVDQWTREVRANQSSKKETFTMSAADIGNLPPRATFGLETIRNFFFNLWLTARDGLRAAGGRIRQACEDLGARCTRRLNIPGIQARLNMSSWEKMTEDITPNYIELMANETSQQRHDGDGSESQC